MKITVATGLYPPEIGGPATHTVLLERELPPLGIEVSVVKFSQVANWPKVLRHFYFAWLVFRSARQADIVFAQDTLSVGLPALIGARLARRPLVIRVPGDYVWEQSRQRFGVTDDIDTFQTKTYGFWVELLRRLQKFTVTSADQVITPSEYFNRLVSGWGVKKDKIKTIYNGIDLNEEAVTPSFCPPRPFLVTAGRLVPWKGIDELVVSLKELQTWTLVVIGDGPERGRLEELAIEKEVSNRVVFTGEIKRSEVMGWCKEADVFVLNSKFESFSYQVAEAMSVGASVIATNIGSLPELISQGKDGLLVEKGDQVSLIEAIRSVEENPTLWQARGKQARETAQKFSVKYTVQKLKDELFKPKS